MTIFFDLAGSLVAAGEHGFRARPEALAEISDGERLGVLCNLPGDARDLARVLEEAGIYERFDPVLLVVASNLPTPLPDRRAFLVAAALAESDIAQCRFVSADEELLSAAATAGMQTTALATDASPGLLGDRKPAGIVDGDTGPTFVLVGRVVTMVDDAVLEDAQVVVSEGRIAAIVPAGQQLAAEHSKAPQIKTGGTIYPGLIDLHNHFVYNVLPLWEVPKRYDNRSQWPRADGYAAGTTLPVRALAENPATAKALVRYVEAKALVGGTTTGQGMRTRVNGGPRLFRGAMRNVEETGDPRLPEAGTMVPSLYVAPDRVATFKTALETRTAYFYHLAEGIDAASRRTYTDLADNDLMGPSLVGVHVLGLEPEDLTALAASGAKGVWSPFSNLLLYGETLDLAAVKASGLPLAIGCDWTPTGSKNLLQELKVARWEAARQNAGITSAELVHAVTAGAASIVGWHEHVGTLKAGAFADLVVIAGDSGDPYDQLIDATEAQVSLVVTHGLPRYGDRALLAEVHSQPDRPLEDVEIGGTEKAFFLQAEDSDLNDLSYAAAREALLNAMGDLHAFRASSAEQAASLNAMGLDVPSFTVDLDNEYEASPDDVLEGGVDATLMADWTKMLASVELDTPEVGGGDYWQRIKAQKNISDELKQVLLDAYGG